MAPDCHCRLHLSLGGGSLLASWDQHKAGANWSVLTLQPTGKGQPGAWALSRGWGAPEGPIGDRRLSRGPGVILKEWDDDAVHQAAGREAASRSCLSRFLFQQ